MSENAVKKENWGSRIGYILSTLGMSIGVGAMWRFPMLTAKYGGGTFVSSGTAITEAEAKAIALDKVPGAAESDIWEFSTDRDDGRLEYEGEIIYDGTKYEFEIDGYSGTIRSWEAEPVRG